MTESKACGHPKDDGELCRTGFGLCEDCGLCFAHCEHREEERRAARVKGADRANRPKGSLPPGEVPPPPEGMEDVVLWYAWSIYAVVTGELDVSRGNTLERLLKGLQGALEAMESREAVEEARREFMEAVTEGVPELEALP